MEMMLMIIYVNGEYYPANEAKVSVLDHGYLYGDGVFEGIRAYNGRVFKLDEHIDRMYQSAGVILLEVPLSPPQMKQAIIETCRRNDITDGYIRVIVSRGSGDLGLDPFKCTDPAVVIIADAIQLYPAEIYETGMKIMTVPTRRNHHEALNPRIKSLNYLNNIMAKIEASLAGYHEVLMLNQEGYVVECTGDNIFVVSEGRLVTPPTHVGALRGITRDTVMELAQARGVEVTEEVFTRFEVYTADECFLTGTACEIMPIVQCDGRMIGDATPGRLTGEILSDFRSLTRTSGPQIWPPGDTN